MYMNLIELFNKKYSIYKMFLSKYCTRLKLNIFLYSLYFFTPLLVIGYNWVVIYYTFEIIMIISNKGFLNYIFTQREKWSRFLIDKEYAHLKEFSNSTMFDIQKNAVKRDKFIEQSGFSLKEIYDQIDKKKSSIASIYLALSTSIIVGLYFGSIRQAMGLTSDFYFSAPNHFKIIMLILETLFFVVLFLIPKFMYTIQIDSLNNFQKIVSALMREESLKASNQIILLNKID